MCSPAVALLGASALVSASSARAGAKAQQQSLLGDAANAERTAIQSENQALVAENNATLADYDAASAIQEGAKSVQRSQLATADLKSRQRVALAANGVDITTGSANDVLTSTDVVGQIDANTIEDNALRSAWGYRTQAQSYRDSAATARADAEQYRQDASNIRTGSRSIRPNAAAAVSLIGSAGQVASAWYAGGTKTPVTRGA